MLTDRTWCSLQHYTLTTISLLSLLYLSLALASPQLCSHLQGHQPKLHLPLPIRSSRASPVRILLLHVSQRWQADLLFAVSLAKHALEPFHFTDHGESCPSPTALLWLWPLVEWHNVLIKHGFCFALSMYCTMHWSTCKTRSSTSYQPPATSNQQPADVG